MSDIWLIIWRFQPFHNGHKLLVDASLKKHSSTLILIWSSNIIDQKNPYSYELRKKIIQSNTLWQEIIISALPDFSSDAEWKDAIVSNISKSVTSVHMYCWDIKNDSAVKSLIALKDTLPFKLNITEIPRSIIPISASELRQDIKDKNIPTLNTYLSPETRSILEL